MLLPAARHLKGLGGMWPHEAPLGPWQQHGGPEQQACDIREDVCKCVFFDSAYPLFGRFGLLLNGHNLGPFGRLSSGLRLYPDQKFSPASSAYHFETS